MLTEGTHVLYWRHASSVYCPPRVGGYSWITSNIFTCVWEGISYKVGRCLSTTHHYLASTDPLEVLACQGVWEQQLPLSGVVWLLWCAVLTPRFLLLQKLSRGTWQKRIGSQLVIRYVTPTIISPVHTYVVGYGYHHKCSTTYHSATT